MKKMESILTVKNNYQYYLANGVCIEYALSPDSSLVDIIDRLVASYCRSNSPVLLYAVYVQPRIAVAINKECASRFCVVSSPALFRQAGAQNLRIETPYGSVLIIPKSNLHLPLFIGSEQELEDNIFNASMEEVLT